jgi:hypothetical protein
MTVPLPKLFVEFVHKIVAKNKSASRGPCLQAFIVHRSSIIQGPSRGFGE